MKTCSKHVLNQWYVSYIQIYHSACMACTEIAPIAVFNVEYDIIHIHPTVCGKARYIVMYRLSANASERGWNQLTRERAQCCNGNKSHDNGHCMEGWQSSREGQCLPQMCVTKEHSGQTSKRYSVRTLEGDIEAHKTQERLCRISERKRLCAYFCMVGPADACSRQICRSLGH